MLFGMKKTKDPTSPNKTGTATGGALEPPPLSLAASFARFLPAAQQLAVERIEPCRFDVNLVFANVQTGLASVLPHLTRIETELPALNAAQFAELSELAGALLYASAQTMASAAPIKREQMNTMLARLHTLREPMLLGAEMYALLGLIPMQRVEQIRSGKGAFDAAQDGVALADLYGEFASVLTNKHPFTAAHFTEIAELGHALMRAITPDGARTAPSPALVAATEARDRLFTLLQDRYDELRRVGAYLFGEERDQKVPTLGARKGRSRAEAAPAAPVPAGGDTAAAGAAAS